MPDAARMLGGVPVGRRVTTECRPALLARAQVHPVVAGLDAFLADQLFRMLDRANRADVRARPDPYRASVASSYAERGRSGIMTAMPEQVLAGASIRRVERHLRHPAHVDPGRRQGGAGPGAAAQSLLVASRSQVTPHGSRDADASARRSHRSRWSSTSSTTSSRIRALGRRGARRCALRPRTVADFYRDVMATLDRHGAAGEDLADAGRKSRRPSGSSKTPLTSPTIRCG